MGATLTSLGRKALRPIRNYNVEERAFKAISKDKPIPAPVPKSLQAVMEEVKNDPTLLSQGKLDPKTLEHLSKVFITSKGDNPVMERRRGLPERKGSDGVNLLDPYEYGFPEPAEIPKGKATLRQVLEFLSNHESKPKEHTVEKLAEEYRLETQDVKNVLKYYKPFQVYIPKKKEKGPKLKGVKLLREKMDSLKL